MIVELTIKADYKGGGRSSAYSERLLKLIVINQIKTIDRKK
jgi:hypothetical protein